MKKIIVCILLFTILCLGCFALTACDKGNDNAGEVSKIEFVKNTYEDYPYICNKYFFRFWYPNNWAFEDIPIRIGYKLSPDEELKYLEQYAEYLFEPYYGTSTAPDRYIKPDSWVYINIEFRTPPETVYFEINTIKGIFDNNNQLIETQIIVLFQTEHDLSGTFKTS